MLRLEDLQDLGAMGSYDRISTKEKEYDEWIAKLFETCGVDEQDKKPLEILLKNIQNSYMESQDREGKADSNKINLLRKMAIHELIYHFMYTWTMRKFIDMRPITQPASLIQFYKKSGDTDTEAVSALSHKTKNGVDTLFLEIQDHVVNKLYDNLEKPEEIPIEELQEYLENQPYNKVIYDCSMVLSKDNFSPMVSNAAVVRLFKDFNKQVIEIDGCIKEDEILLKKQKSSLDIGICFCPYIIPIHSNKGGAIGRFGLWISPDINSNFKRVKVVGN